MERSFAEAYACSNPEIQDENLSMIWRKPMKTQWWMTACAAVLLALTCGVAVAKDQNRGQSKKEYRQFNENQRQYARTYYNQHQNHNQGLFGQDSRWNNGYENRLRPGYVLDRDMRRMSRPAPNDFTRGLGRPPRGYRYVIIGGHLVLVDRGYRVHDTIQLHISF